MNGLTLQKLSRSFGETRVLQEVDLSVSRGEIVGFIGGNGAGKTTTMRMILGMLTPNSGEVLWDGNPMTTRDRRSIGYMPEERGLYPQMNIQDQIVHFALLEGKNIHQAREITRELISTLGLEGREKTLVQDLSLGNQQRVQLAVALVGEPELLVLDEPFSGLDPLAVETMGQLIAQQAAKGVGVLFSSHQLELVERLCDRVCILDRGKVMANGTVEELQDDGTTCWEFVFSRSSDQFLADLSMLTDHRVELSPESKNSVFVSVPGSCQNLPLDILTILTRHEDLRGIHIAQKTLSSLLSNHFISSGRGAGSKQQSSQLTTVGGN